MNSCMYMNILIDTELLLLHERGITEINDADMHKIPSAHTAW